MNYLAPWIEQETRFKPFTKSSHKTYITTKLNPSANSRPIYRISFLFLLTFTVRHFCRAYSSLSSLLNCQAGSAARFTCTSSSVRVSWSTIEIRAWRSAHEIERRRGKRDSDCTTCRSRFRSRAARNSLRSLAPPLTTRSVCTPREGSISTHERNVANIASTNLRKFFR